MSIKIMVCYHKPSRIFKNKYFEPIHVGKEIAKEYSKDGIISDADFQWMDKNLIGDDSGENISNKNRYYCELTAHYWAWKNQDVLNSPEYFGLMHYRRVLNFNYCKEGTYKVSCKTIERLCKQYDVILPEPKIAYSPIKKEIIKNIYEHFSVEHSKEDIDLMKEAVLRLHPEMKEDVDLILYQTEKISWYNIFIARKEIFNQYSKWLFEILFFLEKYTYNGERSIEKMRMMGYYGEILLNIYMAYLKRINKEVKIGYVTDCKVEMGINNRTKRIIQYVKNMRKSDLGNIIILMLFLIKKKKKEKITSINTIHSLTYRAFAPEGGKGGGSAVLSCQKVLMRDEYKNLKLKYTFIDENKYSKNKKNSLWDLWAGALFAKQKVKNEENTVYITHDYGTAFGLYLMGKRYVVVSHLQGPRVEEKKNFGEKFTDISAVIIRFCEKKAFQNAYYVCFPSKGAYDYFCNSSEKAIRREEFKVGPILYNTLYANPIATPFEKVSKKSDTVTFLSVGQLTFAKGIDRCPEFFDELLKHTNKKIRWIIVGEGILKERFLKVCASLEKKYSNFSYLHIAGCSYTNMIYLQEISDVYLMLQRISIFDLATLEAMNKEKAIILSESGGNPEFNKENNIILFSGNYIQTVKEFLQLDIKQFGKRNKIVYDKFFSNDCFKRLYGTVIDDLIREKSKQNRNKEIIINAGRKFKNTALKGITIFERIFHYKTTRTVLREQIQRIDKQEKIIDSLKSPNFSIANTIWRERGATDALFGAFSLFNQSSILWEREDPNLWLIYISMLVEKQRNYEAKEIIDKYYKYFGTYQMERYLLVSQFISENVPEICNENIVKAAIVSNIFKKNMSINLLSDLLKNKTIAIVGNGPSEVGKCNGQTIDDHDIVIRFNNYKVDGFEKDYGTRTDIWVRGSGASDVKDRDMEPFKLVIWEADYYHYPIINMHTDTIYSNSILNTTPNIYFDYETHLKLRKESLIEFPTTGLVTIYAILNLVGDLDKIDIYGFSFLQNKLDGHASHYFNDRSLQESKNRSSMHNFDEESIFIKKYLESFK